MPAPVTTKLRVADQGLMTTAPSTACTRQKYVPAARPPTDSCVTLGDGRVPRSRACANVDDELISQL